MGGGSTRAIGALAVAIAALAAGVALAGCGGSGEDGAAQLARQQELSAARKEAARDARQGVRIAELERRLRNAGRHAAPSDAAPDPVEPPEPTSRDPLIGLWKGEAAIRYESGHTDPFDETIEIDALVPNAPAGYGEAHQGSTTCHGPLTYEGTYEGWYRFSAEEQNVSECIDFSEIELMLDGHGGISYRETTDVSVSTGHLERVN